MPGHGFADGDLLVYGVSGGSAISGLFNGTTYRADAIDSFALQLKPTVTTSLQFVKAVGGATPANAKIIGTDWAARGFRIGDVVTVSGAGGAAANNVSRTVVNIIGTTLEVNGDFDTAETATKTVDGNNAILIDPVNRQSTATHSLVRPGDQKFSNLVDGQTYYIVSRTAGSYQVADTVGGTAKTLGTAGLTGTTVHTFARESVDLTAPLVTSTHQFRIDITGAVSGTTQRIVGPGGVSLATLKPPPGDAVSTAGATGSGKGFVGETANSSVSTATATVTAYIASASLTTTPLASPSTVQGQVSVLADSTTNARATVSNSAGGFVGIGRSNATTTQTSTTAAFIGGNTVIGAGGDVSVQAKSNHITDGNARADSGGFAADVRANMTSTAVYNTTASVRSGAKIVSAGHVDVSTVGDAQSSTKSSADGRGFGGGGYGNTNYTLTGSSLVDVGDNAVVTGNSTSFRATTADMTLYTEAKGWGAGFVGVSINNSNLTATATNTVTVGSGAKHHRLRRRRFRSHLQGHRHLRVLVCRGAGSVRLSRVEPRQQDHAGFERRGRPAHDRHRPARAGHRRPAQCAATRSCTSPIRPTRASAQRTLDHLALYVNTTNSITRIDGNGDYSRRALAAGGVGRRDREQAEPHASPGTPTSTSSPARARSSRSAPPASSPRPSTPACARARTATRPRARSLSETEIFVNDIGNNDPGQAFFDNRVRRRLVGGTAHAVDRRQRRHLELQRHLPPGPDHQPLDTTPLKINNIDVVNIDRQPAAST